MDTTDQALTPVPGQQGAPAPAQAPSQADPSTPPADTSEMKAVRAMADALVQRGSLTRAQADEMLRSDFDPTSPDTPIASTAPAPAAATPGAPADPLPVPGVDPIFDRPATPAEYRFPQATSEEIDVPILQAVQQLAWQARMPALIANDLFSVVDKFYNGPQRNESEIAMLTRSTMSQLQERYGAETPAKVALARRLVADVAKANPSILQVMGTGAGSDPRVVMQIINHASRVYGKE